MYSILKQGNNTSTYNTEYAVDTRADIASLPKDPICSPGSTAICIEDSSVFMLGQDNEWHEL